MLTRDGRGAACLGGVELASLFAPAGAGERLPTPAYVYDLDGIEAEAKALDRGFGEAPHLVAYAVKANSAGAIVRTLVGAGCGAEVVSGNELALALALGVDPERILMSGVAKLDPEIDRAIGAGERGIYAIQVESVEEIPRVEARAVALGRRARVSIRVNPGVEADTHAHITTGHDEAKFGIALPDLEAAYASFDRSPHLTLVGVGCHVGSQLVDTGAYLDAARAILRVAEDRRARGAPLGFVDFGGGFGIDYGQRRAVEPAAFARAATELVARAGFAGTRIVVEPGRALVGAHGVLCASVVLVKRSVTGRRFLIIDAGMNDLIRPALYGAYHRIEPLEREPPPHGEGRFRVVGPVCESSDDFGEHAFGDEAPGRVVIRDAGAYGYTMASEYNGRTLPTQVFLRGGRVVSVSRPRSSEDWLRDHLGE
jgi:diaminopimelate decarboxylase